VQKDGRGFENDQDNSDQQCDENRIAANYL
jgi:hypothetical protein